MSEWLKNTVECWENCSYYELYKLEVSYFNFLNRNDLIAIFELHREEETESKCTKLLNFSQNSLKLDRAKLKLLESRNSPKLKR